MQVNSGTYAKVEKARARWAAKKEYKLLQKDCVSFVAEVAKIVGLKIPDRKKALLPQDFIQKISKLND